MEKTFVCCECSGEFVKTGRNQKRCTACAAATQRARVREANQKLRERQGKLVGVGKGGGTPTGPSHPGWKHGERAFGQRMSKEYRAKVRYCERCGVDTLGMHYTKVCVHHRDHDRTNNVESNFELLCKTCHQVEHKCWENFPNARRSNDYPEREYTQAGGSAHPAIAG